MELLKSGLARTAAFLAGTGSGVAALLALGFSVIWLGTGFTRHFDEPWHSVLHSVSGMVALVMVFVIQFASHRQARAILLKLDELILTSKEARNTVIGIEEAPIGAQERLEDQMRGRSQAGHKA